MRRVLIAGGGTGGHLTPALAIATALRAAGRDLEPVLVGAERGVEAKLLPQRDFRFHLLPAEPLYRRQWWRNARWPMIAWRLIRRVDALLDAEQPAVVIGTGGYASAAVVWRAAGRGIPTAVQEQNSYPGLANRLLARRVREVWLGLSEARAFLTPGAHTSVVETGIPIVPPTPARRDAALTRFGLSGTRPILLVTGGSQGALAINTAVATMLPRLAEDADLLWVTGPATYDRFVRHHAAPGVQVIPFLDPMADGYAVADGVVSRAGMLTVAELCAWGLPSVLIPLPTAAADHQTGNARAMANAGAARFLPQSELTPERLLDEVRMLLARSVSRTAMQEAARRRGRPDAAREIVSRILTLAEPRSPYVTP